FAWFADDPQQVAVGVEDLDAVVARVRGIEAVLGIKRECPDAAKLPRLRAAPAPLLEDLARGCNLADSLELLRLRHVEQAGRIDRHARKNRSGTVVAAPRPAMAQAAG